MKRINGGEGHCATPRRCVIARILRSISCQKHPAFMESDGPIKLDEIISILTFEVAGGTNYQDWPALSWIEICRRSQHSERVRRHDISSLCGQRFFLRAQGNVSLNR